ncbi:MAG: transglutaminaseTgpA domain-containing protein [Polyangiaceae bacterium]|nr:transglutaminaseTgpA domain-containing protein [Polyangiaceae bacterium]
MTDALAAFGVIAVVSAASMTPWMTVFLLGGLALALAVPESWENRRALRYLATGGPACLFVVQISQLFAGRPALDIAVEFAAILQIFRVATRRGAVHDQQIIVLALLHFVTGTVLGGGLTYGLCFLGFLLMIPGALVLSHLRREVEGNYRQGARDRTGLPVDVPRILRSRRVVGRGFLFMTSLLSLPIFFFTAALFVTFPRVGLSLLLLNHARPGRMVGFSDRVDLGEVGVLRNDPTVALRFDIPDLPEPRPTKNTLRFRGTAFDNYNGHAWSRALRERPIDAESGETLSLFRRPDGWDRKVSIDLETIDPPVVFLPPRAIAVELRIQQKTVLGERLRLVRGAEGEVRYSGTDSHGIRYDAYVAGDREPIVETLSQEERTRYLEIPETMPTRIADLAHEWADSQSTPYLKAKAIEDHLKRDYRYDTASPSGGHPEPIDHFLFESKRGHCEFFSTAMAIMLREIGIPSRNVTGFIGGTYNRFGRYYAVRQGDAHSWVEAYLDDPIHGWATFDPTPNSPQPLEETGAYVYLRDWIDALSQRWNRYIVGYDLKTQIHLFENLSRRYHELRAATHADRGAAEGLTRGPVVVAMLLAFAIGSYVWKRTTGPKKNRSATNVRKGGHPKLEAISALYRHLELALTMHGLSRPPSLPPLRYAERLAEQAHPLAGNVLALTHRYIEARFGGVEMNAADRRDFEQRIKDIRAYKAPPSSCMRDGK